MESKYYFYPNSGQELSDAVKEYNKLREQDKDIKFIIITNEKPFYTDSFIENFNKYISNLKELGLKSNDIMVSIETENHDFSIEKWDKIRSANNFFSTQGIKFGFEDMDKTWSIKEVENANSKIVDSANKISSLNYSPFEKMLAAYLNVTRRSYLQEDEGDHYSQSRSIYGIFNSEKIVCVGYSELFKAIINEIGDENIKVYSNHVAVSTDNITKDGGHANLIVYVKDEKYGIDGYYYCDPTWDSGHEKKYIKKLSYFMVPLSDIDKIKFHVRSEQYLSTAPKNNTDSEIDGTKTEVVKKNTKTTYNKNSRFKNLSFTSDNFRFTKKFLSDLIHEKPKVKEIIFKEEIAQSVERCKKLQKEQSSLSKMIEIANQYQLPAIERSEAWKLNDIIAECKQTENYEKFIEFQKNMQEKYRTSDDVDYVKKFIDGYVEHFNKELEEASLYYEKEELEKMKNYLPKTISLIRQKLESDPKYALKLRVFDRRDLKEAYYNISNEARQQALHGETEWGMDLTLDDVLKSINAFGVINPNNTLRSGLNISIRNELDETEVIERINQIPEEEVISKALSDKVCLQDISNFLKQDSESIDIKKITNALTEVAKKQNPDASGQYLHDYVSEIVSYNIQNINNEFEDNATNGFVQQSHNKTYTQEFANQ